MSQVPVELIVAAFQTEDGADNALKQLQAAKKEHLIAIQNAAVIRRDKNDKLHISETADWGGGKGAAVGAIVGGVIGIIFPPSLLAAGAVGAGIGALAAKLRDSGFKDDHLKEIGAALKPGTSAIVAVVEHTWVATLERDLAEQGAKTMREAITADIATQLAQGRDVAYTATSTGDAVSMSRAAVGKDSAEMGNVTMTAEAMTASKVVVDKDNVAAAGVVVTKDAAAAVTMEGKLKAEGEAKTETPQIDSGTTAAPPASAPSSSEEKPASTT
ncbi:DUF1269 domain-containing protein [Anaerolineae bacterium CFX7]|nr:DUF1269 domain-containing protein [Anaerolineae bacterium CFX7]